jgi:FHS family L-fucose permease-like MFS transporter
LIAGGAFWFIPAVSIGAYWAFLLGLFVIAAGMTCLETIANPYTTVLGAPESGATRINIAQTINGGGWILGPIVGGYFVFSGGEGANANAGLPRPTGHRHFAAVVAGLFFPRCRICTPRMKAKNPPDQKNSLKAFRRPAGGHRHRAGDCLRAAVFLYRPDFGVDLDAA